MYHTVGIIVLAAERLRELWALPSGLVFPGCPLADLGSLLHQGPWHAVRVPIWAGQEGAVSQPGTAAANALTPSPHSPGLYYQDTTKSMSDYVSSPVWHTSTFWDVPTREYGDTEFSLPFSSYLHGSDGHSIDISPSFWADEL